MKTHKVLTQKIRSSQRKTYFLEQKMSSVMNKKFLSLAAKQQLVLPTEIKYLYI